MSVKILLFGGLSEALKETELNIELPKPATAQELFVNVIGDDSKLISQWKDHILYAINQEHATGDAMVQDGDEIAFMPPLAGG